MLMQQELLDSFRFYDETLLSLHQCGGYVSLQIRLKYISFWSQYS